MTAFVVPNFSGMAPRYADRVLKESQASFVTNLRPTNGDLRGFRSLRQIVNFLPAGTVYRRAIKFYYPGLDTFEWFINQDVNADAVRSPLATDAFNRIYFTDNSHSFLQVTTLDNIHNGVASTNAGVPRSTAAPTVVPSSGGTDTRAYTYVYVNLYGAIGAPAPPTINTGVFTGAWTISNFGSPGGTISFIDVYRSATGNASSGNYFKIGRVPVGTASFVDNMAADLVPLQPPLTTFTFDEPPVNMQGLTQHSSGALVGFTERTVHFSVPYLPHAWPADYQYTVRDQIVGIAAIVNSIIVLTKSYPTILSGNLPSNIAIVTLPDQEPCTAKRSIVTNANACYYTSPNGLVSISQQGLTRPTNDLLTREEFRNYGPNTVVAAAYGSYYVAFYENSRGFCIGLPPFEPVSFVPLDRYSDVTGLDEDLRTGDLIIIQSAIGSLFDADLDARFQTTWRSKEWISPKPINLGAVQILFKKVSFDETSNDVLQAAAIYNANRFVEGELDTIGGYAIDAALDSSFELLDPLLGGLPPIQPVGGEPLYDFGRDEELFNVRFTLYADGDIIYSKIITDEKTHKLPAGNKFTRFYLEVAGSAEVQRIIVAETARECRVA